MSHFKQTNQHICTWQMFELYDFGIDNRLSILGEVFISTIDNFQMSRSLLIKGGPEYEHQTYFG